MEIEEMSTAKTGLDILVKAWIFGTKSLSENENLFQRASFDFYHWLSELLVNMLTNLKLSE